MSVTVTATVGSASANSFVTVAEATTYLEARLNSSAWVGTEPQKQAVIEATRELSALTWDGYRTDDIQALPWPRAYAENFDAPLNASSIYFDDDVLPQWLKDATCELALEFLRAGTTDIAQNDSSDGVIEKTIDVLTTRWATPSERLSGLQRFRSVWRLIGRYVIGADGTVRLTR